MGTEITSFTKGLQPIIEEEEKDYSWEEMYSSYMNQNIIGYKPLHDKNLMKEYEDEPYSADDADTVLNFYDAPTEDRSNLIQKANSLDELTDMAEYQQGNRKDLELIDSHGAAGMAASLGISLLDVPGWVIGAGAGKAAGMGIKAYKLAGRSAKIAQAAAGGAGAITSVAALQATLGEELTSTQIAINGALGFGIGYATAGYAVHSKAGQKKIDSMITGDTPVQGHYPKEDYAVDFMHSASDRMKASDNPQTREAGYKLTRAMGDVGLQGMDTVNDVKRVFKSFLTETTEQFEDYKIAFKETTGKDLNMIDEQNINIINQDIDYQYGKAKSKAYKELKESQKIVNKQEISDRTDEIKLDIIESSRNKIKDGESEKAFRKRALGWKKSKDRLKQEKLNIEEKQKLELDLEARKKSEQRLEDLISSVDPKYKGAIDILRAFKQKHAKMLVSNDVDGLKNIDTAFHASRQYDAERIAQDPSGAIEAFKRGLSGEFNEMDDELAKAIDKQARDIVDNILASNASMQNIDVDLSLLERLDAENAIKKNARGSNLKGRKLKINGARLTDYMNNDIMSNLTNYSNSVGGKISVKQILGIDKNFKPSQFAELNNIRGKDLHDFDVAIKQAYGTHGIDPRANSTFSKMVRGFNSVNFLNFGGWFGANTLTDISTAANDFGLSRTVKYSTQDIVSSLKGNPRGKSLARYIGFGAEGMANDRAVLYGADNIVSSRQFAGEKLLHKGGAWMSKLNGMNMVTDFMDRVTAMASLDYILTAKGTKFTKTMNRLGLDSDTINVLRANKDFAVWKNGALDNIDLDKLDIKTKATIERGLRRAIADVVLKGNDLDAPEFLTEIFGSHALAKALFQFMRFPTIAYNKVGRKMYHNFDSVDAIVSTATASMILGLITQMKDVGRAEPRYDLSTNKGQVNSASFILERMPSLAFVGLVQTQVDVLGRILAKGFDEEYKSHESGANMGITWDRIGDLSRTGQRILDGTASRHDIIVFKSFLSTNLAWLQPINNMVNDEILDK